MYNLRYEISVTKRFQKYYSSCQFSLKLIFVRACSLIVVALFINENVLGCSKEKHFRTHANFLEVHGK